ncbi:MAG: TolC family protein [Mangrovibacterium sp.]
MQVNRISRFTYQNSKRAIALWVLFVWSHFSYAQDNFWSLEDCLEYALDNNLDIALSQYDLQSAERVFKDNKFSLLPTLNSNVTHGYNWGKSIDPFTNEFASSRVRTNNLYLNSDWLLFSGMSKYHLRKKNEDQYRYQQYNQEVLKRNLKIDVTAQYLQVLMAYQLKMIAEEQLKYSQGELRRIKVLVELDANAPRDALRMNAQLQADSLEFIKTENQLALSMLQLKQYLNIDETQDFHINLASQSNQSLSEMKAVESLPLVALPEMKQVELESSMAMHQWKQAKGERYPSLYLSGSLGSGYSGNNLEIVNDVPVAKSFGNQLKDNFYQSLTMTLAIPIFNNAQVSQDIALAQIAHQQTTIKKKQIYWDLIRKIEQTKVEVLNAQSEAESAAQSYQSAKASFDATAILYREGRAGFIDYLEERNALFRAQVESDKAKVQYVFKLKVLGYYLDN